VGDTLGLIVGLVLGTEEDNFVGRKDGILLGCVEGW